MSDSDDFVVVDATDAVPACTNFVPAFFSRKKCKHCRMPKECHQQVTSNTIKKSKKSAQATKALRLSRRKSSASDSSTSSSDSDESDSDSDSDSDSESDSDEDSSGSSDSDSEWDTESDSELAGLIARLTAFYQSFCPSKANTSYVSTMLESWEGDEEEMFRHLVAEVEEQLIQQEKADRQDIKNFCSLSYDRFAFEAADMIETCVKHERDRVQLYLDHLGITSMSANDIHANDFRQPDVLWSRLIQTHGALPKAQDRALGGVNRYFTPPRNPDNSPAQSSPAQSLSTSSAYGVTAFRV